MVNPPFSAPAASDSRRPRLFLSLATLVVAGLVAWVFTRAPAPAYETALVRRGDLENNVTALGSLQPRDYVDVGAQASGQIQRLHVAAGDVVKKGALLAEIDPRIQQSAVDAGRASLADLTAKLSEQEAQLELALHQHTRRAKLASAGVAHDEELQIAHAALRAASARADSLKAQLAQARSTLESAEAQLGYTRIYAPMDGTVTALDAREGQTLNATQQAPVILRIANLATMTVWTEVSEADVNQVKPGMPVYFTTLGVPDRRWTGTVRQILPAPVTAAAQGQGAAPSAGKVVLYTVLFDIENTGGELLPQMTAQVFFVASSAHAALLAPLAGLHPDEARDKVFNARILDSAGRVSLRTVRLGLRDRLQGEVLSGLSEGDRLIVSETAASPARRLFRW
jgi:membrane fusion protein, macrolide-specific efflux system